MIISLLEIICMVVLAVSILYNVISVNGALLSNIDYLDEGYPYNILFSTFCILFATFCIFATPIGYIIFLGWYNTNNISVHVMFLATFLSLLLSSYISFNKRFLSTKTED